MPHDSINSLKILKVQDPPHMKTKPLHENLPQPPALVLMCSPVKTGKSTIISNLLLNESFFGPEYFDDVHIISNTINNDVTSRFLKERFNVEDTYTFNVEDTYTFLRSSASCWRSRSHTRRRTNLRSH